MKTIREYAVQYIDRFGDACRISENGRTKKYTLEEAREAAKQKRASSGRTTKICKGWTVIEVFEA